MVPRSPSSTARWPSRRRARPAAAVVAACALVVPADPAVEAAEPDGVLGDFVTGVPIVGSDGLVTGGEGACGTAIEGVSTVPTPATSTLGLGEVSTTSGPAWT